MFYKFKDYVRFSVLVFKFMNHFLTLFSLINPLISAQLYQFLYFTPLHPHSKYVRTPFSFFTDIDFSFPHSFGTYNIVLFV